MDMIDVVDESDKVVGITKTKEEIHELGLLHRSVHLLVIKDGKILCRKRADDDFRYAGMFTTTIGTHVLSGSDYGSTLDKFLPCRTLNLEFLGEFRVKDEYENELNGLFVSRISEDQLPENFLNSRFFFSVDKIEKLILEHKTTPHLSGAAKLLVLK